MEGDEEEREWRTADVSLAAAAGDQLPPPALPKNLPAIFLSLVSPSPHRIARRLFLASTHSCRPPIRHP